MLLFLLPILLFSAYSPALDLLCLRSWLLFLQTTVGGVVQGTAHANSSVYTNVVCLRPALVIENCETSIVVNAISKSSTNRSMMGKCKELMNKELKNAMRFVRELLYLALSTRILHSSLFFFWPNKPSHSGVIGMTLIAGILSTWRI